MTGKILVPALLDEFASVDGALKFMPSRSAARLSTCSGQRNAQTSPFNAEAAAGAIARLRTLARSE